MAEPVTGEDEGGEQAPKRKPPPPRVRVRSAEKGPPAAEPEAKPPAPPAKAAEEPPRPNGRSKAKKAPALASGTVAVDALQEAAAASEPSADAARKPPPPHVSRGPRVVPATTPPAAAAPPPPKPEKAPDKPAAPARVSARPARSRAKREAPEAAEGDVRAQEPEFSAPGAASPPTHPPLTTDEGRLAALTAALTILSVVLVVESYAAVVSNSLALFSDAGHVFTDFFAYAIAAAAVTLSQRKSSSRETFGWHRAEVVAAFVSGLILLLVVFSLYLEAANHLLRPEPVDLTYMLTVPWIAVVANLYLMRRLSGAQDVNIEGARLHAVADLMSSLGVIAGGVLIAATGNRIFDPLVTFFIGILILRSAIHLLRQSLDILLEKSPEKIDVSQVISRVTEVEGVEEVHQIHAWSLCSTVHAVSAHIVRSPSSDAQKVLEAARAVLVRDFHVAYTTLQVEAEPCGADQHPTAAHGPAEHLHSHA